jgi:hypothetical protein
LKDRLVLRPGKDEDKVVVVDMAFFASATPMSRTTIDASDQHNYMPFPTHASTPPLSAWIEAIPSQG